MQRKFKTALVTGASSGIGNDIAKRLISEGFTVYAAARNIDKMADLASAGAIVLSMDISKDEQVVAAVERIKADHGGIDVLVNNAGYGQYGPVEDTPVETARYQFEVNLFGLARLTQLLLPGMRSQRKGLIVNVSSVGGKIYTPLGAWYHATKHALEGWSDCLRLELKEFGIDVVIVEPGIIRTGFSDALGQNFARSDKSAYAKLIDKVQVASAQAYESGRGSPPSVISDVVVKAIKSPRPKTRYSAGALSGPLLFLRRVLSDRIFDRIIMSQV